MSAKHTPGPWVYQENSDAYTHIVRGPNNAYVAGLSQNSNGVAEADARLIAAAPDMLDALEAALDELHEVNLARSYGNPPRNPEMTVAAEAKARIAIEKAKGGAA